MGLTIKKTVSLNYSAARWDLFDDMPGASQAARYLNKAFSDSVNAGNDRDTTRRIMDKAMTEQRKYGARDSEPERVLDRLLEKVYGDA